MAAILKFVLLALLGLWLWYSPAVRKLWRPSKRPTDKPSGPAADTSKPPAPESMIRCAHCGLHLPEGEAVKTADGHRYCTAAHRDLGPRDHD